MASKKKRQEAAKKRANRSKILVAVGGVLLIAIGAYEIPKTLALMHPKKPAAAAAAPAPTAPVGGTALPNVATGAVTTTTPAAASGDLADTDVPLASSTNQLVTFDVFQTKNPFTPQVTDSPVPSADAPSAANKAGADVPTSGTSLPTLPSSITLPTLPGLPGSGATATPGGGASTPGQGVVPPGTPTTTTPTTTTTTTTTTTPTTTTAAPSPAVSISVNGTVSRVSTNGTFPSGAPVFRLAGYTRGSARIGIVGGSYQAGGETLTLHQGVPVTLQNTSDGKKYTIQLLSTP